MFFMLMWRYTGIIVLMDPESKQHKEEMKILGLFVWHTKGGIKRLEMLMRLIKADEGRCHGTSQSGGDEDF